LHACHVFVARTEGGTRPAPFYYYKEQERDRRANTDRNNVGKESETVSRGDSTRGREREVANAKEEERQQAEVTRRVAETFSPYAAPPSDKAPRESLGVPGRRGRSAREIASRRESDGEKTPKRKSKRK
jgi:hypothetical protein